MYAGPFSPLSMYALSKAAGPLSRILRRRMDVAPIPAPKQPNGSFVQMIQRLMGPQGPQFDRSKLQQGMFGGPGALRAGTGVGTPTGYEPPMPGMPPQDGMQDMMYAGGSPTFDESGQGLPSPIYSPTPKQTPPGMQPPAFAGIPTPNKMKSPLGPSRREQRYTLGNMPRP